MRRNHVILPILFSIIVLFLFNSCTTEENTPDLASYLRNIEAWQESRNASMRDTSKSWLSLVGLHWLDQGENTFGADATNRIQFPNTAPAFAGTFILQDSLLKLVVGDGVYIEYEGKPIQTLEMKHDMDAATTYLQMGSINFYALKRPEGIAIRVKDSQSPALLAFEDIPNFAIDPSWIMEAQLQWYGEPQPIQIPTVLGSERTQHCPAVIVFEINGEQFELSPYENFYGEPTWSIVFSDLTNGETTYEGGRFLTLDAPAPGAKTILVDFNMAYNPPCSFSVYATCPLPPPENRLSVAIPAGEREYAAAH